MKSGDAKRLEAVFYAKSPEYVNFSEDSSRLKEVKKIPIEEFSKQQGFQWTDSMLVSPEIRDKLWEDKEYPKKVFTPIEERLHNPLNNFVIAINNELGKGVFVSLDSKPIPIGTIIGIHAGEIGSSDVVHYSDYAMDLATDEQKDSVISKLVPHAQSWAEQYGNFTRYIQDLPSEEELTKLNAPKLVKNNIAVENIMLCPTIYCGCPITLMITTRDIQPGEQLGYSYGDMMWSDAIGHIVNDKGVVGEIIEKYSNIPAKQRCIFNKKGEVIGHIIKKDEEQSVELKDSYKPTKEMNAPRVQINRLRAVMEPLLVNPKEDGFDYKKSFITNVIFALKIFATRYSDESDEAKFIKQLLDSFIKVSADPNHAYHCLRNAWKDPKNDAVCKKLDVLRKECSFNMCRYYDRITANMSSAPAAKDASINSHSRPTK